jgi:hypothetical protein
VSTELKLQEALSRPTRTGIHKEASENTSNEEENQREARRQERTREKKRTSGEPERIKKALDMH